ncbi:MAG: hypothetical protein KF775_06970 [Cyclobacteriaceae bacterium]|nr:hypothetical protein [Cyclobacteriaceae bacterium]
MKNNSGLATVCGVLALITLASVSYAFVQRAEVGRQQEALKQCEQTAAAAQSEAVQLQQMMETELQRATAVLQVALEQAQKAKEQVTKK